MSQKRKRSSTAGSDIASSPHAHLPSDSINPFSRTPGQLLQFSIAGLSETDEDPSLRVPDFPHRGLSHGLRALRQELTVEEDESEDEAEKEKKKPASHREKQVRVLIQSMHQFLDRGDVQKAARAYGLVLQLQPHGRPVDVRHHNLWAIGAEILMRDGEKPPGEEAARGPDRWGSAANMHRVKAYFETLIQQFPYDHRRPQYVSSLDFWLAMLSCEIYNTHAEHVIRLSHVEDDMMDWEDDGPLDGEEDDMQDRRQLKLDDLRDQARLKALRSMREIMSRMDGVIRDQPFAKSLDFHKLRATVSLYLADLIIPVVTASPLDAQQAQERSQMEKDSARDILQKVVDMGGELDQPAMELLGTEDDDDDDDNKVPWPTYASLPIREV